MTITQTADSAIDWQQCLSVTGNNSEIALEILRGFMDELPIQIKAIQDHFQTGDYSALQKAVHQLHGAACYCGMPALQKQLHDFEISLKQNHEAQYAERLHALLSELNRVQHFYQYDFDYTT
jgi:two-component system sensor histidine kinase BarA